MKKRILPLLLAALICWIAVRPFGVCAAPLQPDASASLTLTYQIDGTAFSDLSIEVFRVAEAFPNGTFELITPFSSYPVNIHDITAQSQWRDIAATLSAYIVADQVAPDRTAQTDTAGIARFSDLQTGLYLVRKVVADNAKGTYRFNQFMVYVPTPQPDGSFAYDVAAKPKCESFTPSAHYTVTKLWQDDGTSRLPEVTVDIYRNGILFETKRLSAENNWSYTWYVTGNTADEWTVAERDVPNTYKVTLRQNGNVFFLVNTSQPPPEPPPYTGDSFAALPWILVMCISGIMLLILGFWGRRRK